MTTFLSWTEHPIFFLAQESARGVLAFLAKSGLRILSRLFSIDGRWILRHSATQKGGFNIFLSDIDFSFVSPGADAEQIAKAKRIYFGFKRVLPWLGEVEMYSEQEYSRLQTLIPGSDYFRIRHFRKINWMTTASESTSSRYKKFKYQRALEKSIKALNVADALTALNQIVTRHTSSDLAHPGAVFSPYLGCWLNSTQPVFPLPSYTYAPEKIVALLAGLPPAEHENESIRQSAVRLREEPTVEVRWSTLNEIEWLTVRAVNRGSRVVSENMAVWERALAKGLNL